MQTHLDVHAQMCLWQSGNHDGKLTQPNDIKPESGRHPPQDQSIQAWLVLDSERKKKAYCVVSTTGYISNYHIWDRQDLPVLGLLNEDGHPPGYQLTVIFYPLCPGDEFPI